MPYTTLVGGTTITASWANANVRDQTISPFASTSARDAAITSPLQGMYCYTTDTNSLWHYNGSKWLLDMWISDKAADQSWTSNAVLADVTDLSRAVDANSHYWFCFNLGVIGPSTTGVGTQLNAPSLSRIDTGQYGLTFNTGALFDGWVQAGNNVPGVGAYGQGPSNISQARVEGVLATGSNAGTFKIQAAQQVSGAATSWVLRGSTFSIRQVS